jgi:Zn-dependent peptidase ImmA (M78 family)/transcriptional regulator with XRE-family HTH domain
MSTVHLAANLRRIRTARDLTQGQVATRAGLSRAAYNAIETGASAARVDTIGKLAEALEVPATALLEVPVLRDHIRFRAEKRLVSREDILARVAKWLDDYTELERLTEVAVAFPFEGMPRSRARGEERARQRASEARTVLGLSESASIGDVGGLLEEHGIKIGALDVSSVGFFGLSVGKGNGGPAIVVNTWNRISVERWIFTAVHELGHLLLHLDAYDVRQDAEDQEQEIEAHIFATHFLMPEAVFQAEWDKASGLPLVERVLKVKAFFRVSCQVVLHRAFPEAPHQWPRFQSEYRAMTGRTLSVTEEPLKLSPFQFKVGRRDRLVRKALETGTIDLARAADILGIPSAQMQARAAAWRE